MTWTVIALQAALILTFAVTPSDPPHGPHLLQLIWAAMHKPTFYPLAALLFAGPPLTYLAVRTPGRHRIALTLAWAACITLLLTTSHHRIAVMLRILWEQTF